MRHQLEWLWCESHSGLLIAGLCGAVVFAVLGGLQVANAADWPCYRGPNKDGHTTDTIGKWPPTELWRTQIGKGYSQVVVSEGRVYTMGWSNNQDHVYCFSESSSGTNPPTLWKASYANSNGEGTYPGTRSTPTVDGNEVYTFSADGYLKCFNKTNGSPNWSVTINKAAPMYAFAGSPLIEGDSVIVNAGGAGTAIDKSGAHTNWTSSGSSGYASPFAVTIGTQRTVVIYAGNFVTGLNPVNGNTNWYYPMGIAGLVDPIVYGNLIWISKSGPYGMAGGSVAMNLGSGLLTSTAWTDPKGGNTGINDAIYDNGYIYCMASADKGGLVCMDAATGDRMWASTNSHVNIETNSSVFMAGNQLVVLNEDKGVLYVVEATPSSYTEVHRFTNTLSGVYWTCPTLANGKLYVRTQNGNMICYDVGSQPPPSGTNIPPAEWIEQYYPGTDSNDYPVVASSDTDGDGMTAWQEYVAGTVPTNSSSCLRAGIVTSNGNVLVSWPTLSATGAGYSGLTRYYDLESRLGLLGGAWQGVGGVVNISGNNSTVIYTNATPSSAGFYRIKTWLQ
jgi:outer membrane protein assembly factor BamB